MSKTVVISRLATAAIVFGSIMYGRYQLHKMDQEIQNFGAKIEEDKIRINEKLKNLGKH